MVRSPDSGTDFFNIVAGILQCDTLALDVFIICLDYVLRISIDIMKENGLRQKRQEEDDVSWKVLQITLMN